MQRSRLLVLVAGTIAAMVAQGCILDAGDEAEDEDDFEYSSSEFAADSCSSQAAPQCPARSAAEGKGLVDIQRCAFKLSEKFVSGGALSGLEKITKRVSLQQVLGDLNRTAKGTTSIPGNPAGVARGFAWESDDNGSPYWIPQGITGSADSTGGLFAGKNVLLVSWHHDPAPKNVKKDTREKGVRIAIVDASGKDAKYRFALLVKPTGTAAAPSFQVVNSHAGGIVWFKNYLYVADTEKGIRVFDMNRIMQVEGDSTKKEAGCSGGKCKALDYRYVIPQVGEYKPLSCNQRFSFLSLDRSTNPPSLISGEWCDGKSCPALGGRLYRWELNPTTGRINRAYPIKAWLMGQQEVQGGASENGQFYLTSSKPAGIKGVLHRVTNDKSKSSQWADGPEDLMIDRANDLIYSLTEKSPRRIFAVRQSSYPKP